MYILPHIWYHCNMGLNTNTRLPAPTGWLSVRNVRHGDRLLDEAGYVCQVEHVSDPYLVTGYELKFGWGKKKEPEDFCINAGPEQRFCTIGHRVLQKLSNPSERLNYVFQSKLDAIPINWPVFKVSDNANAKPIAREVTATEISETLLYERKHGKAPTKYHHNHAIPATLGVNITSTPILTLHPYILGVVLNYWDFDEQVLHLTLESLPYFRSRFEEFSDLKLDVQTKYTDKSPRSKRIKCKIQGMNLKLSSAKVASDGRIPIKYLRASERDRMYLLAGLTDKIGAKGNTWSGERNSVEYSHSRPTTVKSVAELLFTLGYPAYIKQPNKGSLRNKALWVEWHPIEPPQMNPTLRVRSFKDTMRVGNDMERYLWKTYSCDKLEEDFLVRDIVVNSPHGMYLAGELYLPVVDDKGLR